MVKRFIFTSSKGKQRQALSGSVEDIVFGYVHGIIICWTSRTFHSCTTRFAFALFPPRIYPMFLLRHFRERYQANLSDLPAIDNMGSLVLL